MRVLLFLCLVCFERYSQETTFGFSVESSMAYWGVGFDVYIIPDTLIILTAGLVFSSEYGSGEIPGIYAWSPPAPHSWWKFRGDHETKKNFPGISFGVLFFRTVHLNVVIDYTNFDKYKIWYSPAIDAEFHTKNGSDTKFGSGAGLHFKVGEMSYLGIMYHHIKGFGLRYTFAGI